MISVLCPTRGRPGQFRQSFRSLFETADDPHGVEVRARLDDDEPFHAYDIAIDRDYGDRVIGTVGPRHGYQGLHRYYNELAALATGDYLLLWNDDARMLTAGWDTFVHLRDPTVPFVATPGGGDHPFPLISRAFYNALGHFSLNPHCDTWVCEVGKAVGCMVDLGPVEIGHLRDELDDETKRDGVRAQERVTLAECWSDETAALRLADVERLRGALA